VDDYKSEIANSSPSDPASLSDQPVSEIGPPPDAQGLRPATVWRAVGGRSQWPLRLAVAAGIVSLLCLGAAAIGYHYYDNATRPDRTSPQNALNNYFIALLTDNNPQEAAKYVCAPPNEPTAFASYVEAARSFAANAGDSISFTWVSDPVNVSGDHVDARVVITQSTSKDGRQVGESRHVWIFNLVSNGEWAVCGSSAGG
jgi:hypothetical protein